MIEQVSFWEKIFIIDVSETNLIPKYIKNYQKKTHWQSYTLVSKNMHRHFIKEDLDSQKSTEKHLT